MAKTTPQASPVPTTPTTDAPATPTAPVEAPAAVEAPSSAAPVEAPAAVEASAAITLESGTRVELDANKRATIARVLATPQARVRPERAPSILAAAVGISAADARAAIAAYKSELRAPRP